MEEKGNGVDSISLAIARIFYELQTAQEPSEDGNSYHGSVSIKCLIKSFGWTGEQVFEQHDIQEAARILLDDLQQKMRETRVSEVIRNLFQGTVESGVKCINVDYKSYKKDIFYDIQLDVRGCNDIYHSFEKYIKPERLDGDNKYHAEGHGLQDAEKVVNFKTLPKVLMLHLKRFEYTPFGTLQKVSDVHQFYDQVDLTKYVKQSNGNKREYKYSLHAVLIHKGSTVTSGHYVVAVNVSSAPEKKEWYLFDDERVSKLSSMEAIQANFGGSSSTAYMLVYVRHDAITDMIKPVTKQDVPEFLQEKFKREAEGCTIL